MNKGTTESSFKHATNKLEKVQTQDKKERIVAIVFLVRDHKSILVFFKKPLF